MGSTIVSFSRSDIYTADWTSNQDHIRSIIDVFPNVPDRLFCSAMKPWIVPSRFTSLVNRSAEVWPLKRWASGEDWLAEIKELHWKAHQTLNVSWWNLVDKQITKVSRTPLILIHSRKCFPISSFVHFCIINFGQKAFAGRKFTCIWTTKDSAVELSQTPCYTPVHVVLVKAFISHPAPILPELPCGSSMLLTPMCAGTGEVNYSSPTDYGLFYNSAGTMKKSDSATQSGICQRVQIYITIKLKIPISRVACMFTVGLLMHILFRRKSRQKSRALRGEMLRETLCLMVVTRFGSSSPLFVFWVQLTVLMWA